MSAVACCVTVEAFIAEVVLIKPIVPSTFTIASTVSTVTR